MLEDGLGDDRSGEYAASAVIVDLSNPNPQIPAGRARISPTSLAGSQFNDTRLDNGGI